MKKTVFVFMLLVSLSACVQKTENNLNNRIVSETESGQVVNTNEPIEGILKAQEVKLNMYGTHVLEDEMGAFLIYLQSKKINLSSYVDAKVSVEGDVESTFDGKKILEVNKVDLFSAAYEEIEEAENKIYISTKLGINLTLPAEWQKEESENLLTIYADGENPLLQINKIPNENEADLRDFIEEVDFADLTINEYEAVRTTENSKINVYIKAGGSVYKVVFTPIEESATEKSQFYAVLKTFALNEAEKKETYTRVCAGAGKIECDVGYRCEISSDKELATGICVKVDGDTEEIDSNVLDMIEQDIVDQNQIKKLAQLEAEELEDSEEKIAVKIEKFQVIDYINEYLDDLIKGKEIENVQIEGYEFTNNVVSVILKDSEKKYKIQYLFEVVDEYEVDLEETAYFVEGDGRDWEKVSGEDKQFDTEKEVISSAGETQAVVYDDMRYYENSHQNYSLQYPRSWYYASFGSVNGSIWHVGFSDEEVELGNEKISVDIFSGKADNVTESNFGGVFRVNVPRDEESHFEIFGDVSLEETIKRMAETITQN